MSEVKILKPGHNCWDIAEVAQTGLLIDGRDYYRAFYRAARAAKSYILLSGWQYDSKVHHLRGEDARAAGEESPLLAFLNDLCGRNSALRIFILAWDFSVVYGLDREWFQEWYFNWTTNERLKFCFDRCESMDASHHQKFVVDGKIALVGAWISVPGVGTIGTIVLITGCASMRIRVPTRQFTTFSPATAEPWH